VRLRATANQIDPFLGLPDGGGWRSIPELAKPAPSRLSTLLTVNEAPERHTAVMSVTWVTPTFMESIPDGPAA